MKNTNISQLGCSTLGEQMKEARKARLWNDIMTVIIVLEVVLGILLIISFLTIPR